MKPEDEVSFYRWLAAFAGGGTTGREGTSDRVEIGLRESGRPRAEEIEA